MAPSHLKGDVVTVLGQAQGHEVGNIWAILFFGQLHYMPRESIPNPNPRNEHEEQVRMEGTYEEELKGKRCFLREVMGKPIRTEDP